MRSRLSNITGALVALMGLFSCASLSRATAQDWAKANLASSPRHGEYVTIHEAGGRDLQAWVVYPETKGKAPVVVMIHEIFGQSDWAREMADEVAGAGYIVVEPDLLSGFGAPAATTARAGGYAAPRFTTAAGTQTFGDDGPGAQTDSRQVVESKEPWSMPGMGCDPLDCGPGQVPLLKRIAESNGSLGIVRGQMNMGQGGNGAPYVPATPGGTSAFPDQSAVVKAVSALPDAQVMLDLDAAAGYGKHLPAASGKLFVAGFCWGGGKTFLFATHRHDLSGAFVFYGPPPAPELMKSITAPVYGFYGGNDPRISSTVDPTKAAMKEAGKVYEPVIYDGAGHGFMRAGEAPDATAANSAARQAGFRRLVQLLGGVR